jgi:hypothetical protein
VLMSWKKWLRRRKDPLFLKCAVAFSVMELAAQSSFDRFQPTSSCLLPTHRVGWEHYVTVANVFASLAEMRSHSRKDRYLRLAEPILEEVKSSHGERHLTELQQYVEERSELGKAVCVGAWVLWKVLGRPPVFGELQEARAIGTWVLERGNLWWKSANSLTADTELASVS